MKLSIACVAFSLIGSLSLSALPTDVTYAEGDATIRLKNGRQQDAQIGDVLNTGDTVRTGKDGLAELDQRGVTIKIASGTVFTLMEKSQGGETSSVMSVALGSIKFKYDKLTGKEPLVRTNGATAGVRGTEFTVFAGADGSTLIAVDSGQVTVESEGASVDLSAQEGVEVPLGKPPGDKISVHSDQVDYRSWNDERLSSMLADPTAAIDSIQRMMEEYAKSVADYQASYLQAKESLDAERVNRAKVYQDKGADAATKYEQDVVTPLSLQAGWLQLNVRYYALAALSLRRFVAGRLYVFAKARSITETDSSAWSDFQARFARVLELFEQSIAPQLTATDI